MAFGCFAGYEGFGCSIAWLLMVLIFFISAIFRKQIAEGLLNTEFSLIGSVILGEVGFVVGSFLTHSFKWSFLIGMFALVVGGLVGSKFLPDGGSDND